MFPAVSDGNNIPALSVKSCNLRHTIRKYKQPRKASAHNWRHDCALMHIESVTLVSYKVKGPIHRPASLMGMSIDCVSREDTSMVRTCDLHIKMTQALLGMNVY